MITLQRPSQLSSTMEKDEEEHNASGSSSKEMPSSSHGTINESREGLAHGAVDDDLADQFAHHDVAICDTQIELTQAEGGSQKEVEDGLVTAYSRLHFARRSDVLSFAEDTIGDVLSSAVVAAEVCETARVATEEASRAGARLLLEAANSGPATATSQVRGIHAGRAGWWRRFRGPVPEPMGLNDMMIARGDILAWCEVRILAGEVQCEMDVGKFIFANLASIGISCLVPLTVMIRLGVCNPRFRVRATQQVKLDKTVRDDSCSSNSQSLGLRYLVPYVVSSFLQSRAQRGSSNNIFIELMQMVALYLSRLNFICCICQDTCCMPSDNAQSCRENLCMATLETWGYVAQNYGRADRGNSN